MLHETLKSIKTEISSASDIEWKIIAVDDGSTDNSLEILTSWSNRLPLTIEQTNHTGSPAQPRNRGIELADTKYVYFLDADDVLIEGGLSAAVSYAESTNSDVVVTRLVSLDGRGVPRGMFKENRQGVTLKDSRIYWALNPMKLIRRDLLITHSIHFDDALSVGEDQPFSALAYLKAEKVSILASPPVVGVRYTKSGTNMTLQVKSSEKYFQLLDLMFKLLNDEKVSRITLNHICIRHWEIEIARELIWNSMPFHDSETWTSTLAKLNMYSNNYLIPEMLPQTSIRWRGIVGLIGTQSYDDLISLINARKRALNGGLLSRIRGHLTSNWIRLKATVKLPKNF